MSNGKKENKERKHPPRTTYEFDAEDIAIYEMMKKDNAAVITKTSAIRFALRSWMKNHKAVKNEIESTNLNIKLVNPEQN
jgi:hypothetical protein